MSRIRTGDFGIYAAYIITRVPKEYHEHLTHIFISMSCYTLEDKLHMRRLIEVNIPRQEEKKIIRYVKATQKLLRNNYDKNWDAVKIFNALYEVAECITITSEIEKEKEREEINYEKENNKSKNNREVVH